MPLDDPEVENDEIVEQHYCPICKSFTLQVSTDYDPSKALCLVCGNWNKIADDEHED